MGSVGFVTESLVGVAFFLMAKIIDNLIAGASDSEAHPFSNGLAYSFCFAALLVVIVFMRHNYYLANSVTMVEMRQSLTALIFRKTLKLSLRSLSL